MAHQPTIDNLAAATKIDNTTNKTPMMSRQPELVLNKPGTCRQLGNCLIFSCLSGQEESQNGFQPKTQLLSVVLCLSAWLARSLTIDPRDDGNLLTLDIFCEDKCVGFGIDKPTILGINPKGRGRHFRAQRSIV